MTYERFSYFVKSDLYRYAGALGWRVFWPNVLFRAGFKYTYLLRLCSLLYGRRLLLPLYIITKILLRHYRFRYGIDIPSLTDIGPGLYIGHSGGIVVNGAVTIGKNCNLSPNIVIGQVNRGSRAGVPIVGDSVYIAPGAQIIGNLRVGHHAAIGAGAVVTRDVPDYGVVVGVPARVISHEGSVGYINKVLLADEPKRTTMVEA